MKFILVFVFFFVCLTSGAQYINQQPPPTLQQRNEIPPPSRRDKLIDRIKEDAIKHSKEATGPRYIKYDIAFAPNLNAFEKLNTFGVLYVCIISKEPMENPVKYAYLKTPQEESAQCGFIARIKAPVRDSIVQAVYGKYQVDYYFFIPYFFTKTPGKLTLDWMNNQKSTILCQFPQDYPLKYLKNPNAFPDNSKQIDDRTIKEFVFREYQLNISNK